MHAQTVQSYMTSLALQEIVRTDQGCGMTTIFSVWIQAGKLWIFRQLEKKRLLVYYIALKLILTHGRM